jgi:hypothetical protein
MESRLFQRHLVPSTDKTRITPIIADQALFFQPVKPRNLGYLETSFVRFFFPWQIE